MNIGINSVIAFVIVTWYWILAALLAARAFMHLCLDYRETQQNDNWVTRKAKVAFRTHITHRDGVIVGRQTDRQIDRWIDG